MCIAIKQDFSLLKTCAQNMRLEKSILFLVVYTFVVHNVEVKSSQKGLVRKKRYIAFPEGASFSAVWCLTSQMGITDGATIFTEGINWGLIYDLPNDTKPFFDPVGAAQKRRNRRDLYVKVEDILTSMGYNGKACILRSLCEASRSFKSRENNLVIDILRLIFRFPEEPVLSHEPDEHRLYHWASRIGSRTVTEEEVPITEECSDIFQCPFSIIDMALGYYSGNTRIDSNFVH